MYINVIQSIQRLASAHRHVAAALNSDQPEYLLGVQHHPLFLEVRPLAEPTVPEDALTAKPRKERIEYLKTFT